MAVKYHDYYEVLGLSRNATDKEIKTAYRKLAREWHPDLHQGKDKDKAEEKFKTINEAYEVLSDPDKRTKYDNLGANWQDGENFNPSSDMGGFEFHNVSGDAGFSDFFEILFGGRNPFGRGSAAYSTSSRPVQGQDIEAELEVTLEEAYHGNQKNISLNTGPRGGMKSIAVTIPAGVQEGSRIRLKGQGSEGRFGGPQGDLYLKIIIKPHHIYKLVGRDLEVQTTVRPEQAVLGDQITVPTLDGPVKMKIPAGVRMGTRMRLKGKGLPDKNKERGDQYVVIKIDIPEKMTEEMKELYRRIAELNHT